MLYSKNSISQASLNISLGWFPLIDKRFPQVRADFVRHTYECQVPCRRFLDTPIEGVVWIDYIFMKFFYFCASLRDKIFSFNKGNISVFI